MKIGIVTTWFERGSAYVSKQYKKSLEDEGHEVLIFARSGEDYAIGDKKWDTPHVTWSKRYSFPVGSYVDSREFKKWLLENKVEAVLFNEQTWLQPVQVCRKLGVKTALYIDYYTENHIDAYGVFDVLICNTKKHYKAFSWHPQCTYIPWGTDVEIFNTSANRVSSDKLRFFHSAGMSPYRKGTDLLLRAYELSLTNSEFRKNTELIIHSQVDLRQALLAKRSSRIAVNSLDAIERSANLKTHEGTVSAPGLYHLGDIYVYPSRLDGVGLTVAEAVACGMPVVVPNDGPMNEFVPPSGSHLVEVERLFARADGYYWPQNEISIDDLASKLRSCYEDKPSLAHHSGVSRDHALKYLNWSNNNKSISDAFTKTKQISVSENVLKMALTLHSKKYPGIDKWESMYRYGFSFYSAAKKFFR